MSKLLTLYDLARLRRQLEQEFIVRTYIYLNLSIICLHLQMWAHFVFNKLKARQQSFRFTLIFSSTSHQV